ncbi:uncharacterized protein METZ01_LOCUS212727 [marine metagenome]|uniref:Uncharacterized protein n=1 Tax=marine metagenome TaxID=408172 RepID=A0A382FCD0_9ZZZZ
MLGQTACPGSAPQAVDGASLAEPIRNSTPKLCGWPNCFKLYSTKKSRHEVGVNYFAM